MDEKLQVFSIGFLQNAVVLMTLMKDEGITVEDIKEYIDRKLSELATEA